MQYHSLTLNIMEETTQGHFKWNWLCYYKKDREEKGDIFLDLQIGKLKTRVQHIALVTAVAFWASAALVTDIQAE